MNKYTNIQEVIQQHGKDNLRFLVPMRPVRKAFGLIGYTSSSDTESKQVCKIVEERYKLSENYKIELRAEDKDFGKESYYISDLNQLINSGYIRVFVEL